jgi:hypothetical protein
MSSQLALRYYANSQNSLGTIWMYDHSKVDELLSAVRSAKSDHVLRISEHFAGYFDELGITVSVKADTSDDEIRDLKNQIATVLSRLEVPFRWMVLFERDGGEGAGVLFPDGLFTGE